MSQREMSPLLGVGSEVGQGRGLLENTSELEQMELEPRPPSFQAREAVNQPAQSHSMQVCSGQLLPE